MPSRALSSVPLLLLPALASAGPLDDLDRAVEGADAPPTPDARVGVVKARLALDRLSDVQAALEADVAQLGR